MNRSGEAAEKLPVVLMHFELNIVSCAKVTRPVWFVSDF